MHPSKQNKNFNNPIDQIMKTVRNDSMDKNKILFEAGGEKDEDTDLRSDLVYPEEVYVSTLLCNDVFLISKGLKPVYSGYLRELLRKRISLDRGSRSEFVNVNKKDYVDENLAKIGSISNLAEVRK